MNTADPALIEQIAGDWFARREFGLSPAEAVELVDWLNADPRHARIFGELEQTARLLDPLIEAGAPATSAAGLARPRYRRLAWAAGLAAAGALAAVALWRTDRPTTDFTLAADSAAFGYRVLDLPDGSVVRLNAGTMARVHYTAGERRVQLDCGEAIFTVAKNKDRPFYVDSGRVSVRAVGTAFNVRLQADSVEIMVTEGKVRVEDSAQRTSLLPAGRPDATLDAGQRVTVRFAPAQPPPTVAAIEAVSPAEQVAALAWQEKRLTFGAVPLAKVVEEFNRYHSRQLVIVDPVLAQQEFGGTFRADGTETLLNLLEQNFDVVVDRQPAQTILRRRAR